MLYTSLDLFLNKYNVYNIQTHCIVHLCWNMLQQGIWCIVVKEKMTLHMSFELAYMLFFLIEVHADITCKS